MLNYVDLCWSSTKNIPKTLCSQEYQNLNFISLTRFSYLALDSNLGRNFCKLGSKLDSKFDSNLNSKFDSKLNAKLDSK